MSKHPAPVDAREQHKTCLVTRPAHQSAQLSEMLQTAGYSVINFPTIEIQAAPKNTQLEALTDHLQSIDIALFVSRNAVDYAFQYLDAKALPQRLLLGVIGKGTWQALQRHSVASAIIPADSYNSEGLLASAALQQIKGRQIVIFRGQEGRNLLGDTLVERGARVEYIEVYQRALPDYADGYFAELSAGVFPDLAIFTSAEGLINCFQLLNETEAQGLRQIPWLLITERMRETARHLGHNAAIIIANSASDEGIFDSLQEWQQSQN